MTAECTYVPQVGDALWIMCTQCGHLASFHVPNGCELCKIPTMIAAAVGEVAKQEMMRKRRR